LDGDGVLEANPAKEESHGVVVEVKETEGSLAQHDEDSVEKLIELGEIEDVEPEVQGALAGRFTFVVTYKTVESVVLCEQVASKS
jgi:hypothetical protein